MVNLYLLKPIVVSGLGLMLWVLLLITTPVVTLGTLVALIAMIELVTQLSLICKEQKSQYIAAALMGTVIYVFINPAMVILQLLHLNFRRGDSVELASKKEQQYFTKNTLNGIIRILLVCIILISGEASVASLLIAYILPMSIQFVAHPMKRSSLAFAGLEHAKEQLTYIAPHIFTLSVYLSAGPSHALSWYLTWLAMTLLYFYVDSNIDTKHPLTKGFEQILTSALAVVIAIPAGISILNFIGLDTYFVLPLLLSAIPYALVRPYMALTKTPLPTHALLITITVASASLLQPSIIGWTWLLLMCMVSAISFALLRKTERLNTASYDEEAEAWKEDLTTPAKRYYYQTLYENLLPSSLKGKKAADIGCGAGAYTFELHRRGAKEVHAVDMSQGMLSVLRKRARANALKVLEKQASIEKLPYRKATFDHVISVGVLECLQDDAKALAELHRVLKENGTLGLRVINRRGIWGALEQCRETLGIPSGIKAPTYYTYEEILERLTRAGFIIEETKGSIIFPAFLLPFARLLEMFFIPIAKRIEKKYQNNRWCIDHLYYAICIKAKK
ncbi:class I SAM-dependent methyltransferase [Candidatus Woesearchaeota archaeon]|nr:class I SAM-dependent methyltransferase [Candidatus Woesearchaeota archaeon]